jgi:hypothetical protein
VALDTLTVPRCFKDTEMENSNRYWSTEYHHNYPWHTIASAYWKRYPNPHSKHVYSEDMIDVKVRTGYHVFSKGRTFVILYYILGMLYDSQLDIVNFVSLS